MIENFPIQFSPQYRNSILVQSCQFFYHPDISTFEQAKQKIGNESKFLIYFDQESVELKLVYSVYDFEKNARDFYVCKLNPDDTMTKLAVFFQNLKITAAKPVIYSQFEEHYVSEANEVIKALNAHLIEVGQSNTSGNLKDSLIPLNDLFNFSKDYTVNTFSRVKIQDIIEISADRVILLLYNGLPLTLMNFIEKDDCFFDETETKIINIAYKDYQNLKKHQRLPEGSFFVYPINRYLIVKQFMQGNWLEQICDPKFKASPISKLKSTIEQAPGYDAEIDSKKGKEIAKAKLLNSLNELKSLANAKLHDKILYVYILRPSSVPGCYAQSIMNEKGKVTHHLIKTCEDYFNFFVNQVLKNCYSINEIKSLSQPLQPLLIRDVTPQLEVRENNSLCYSSPLQSARSSAAETENKEDKEGIDNIVFTYK